MELNGKIILVAGGATGIGAATARLCAQRGGTVIVADRDEVSGTAVAAECHGPFLAVNVADEASVKAMYAKIDQQYGRLDVLLHTAGILKGAYVPLAEFPLETFRNVIEVNTVGSFLCVKHSVPLFEKAGKGVIVLVSSGAATGGSSSFAYGTSKGGVNSLGVLFNNSLSSKNIRVNVVSPGNIDTPLKRSVIVAEVEKRGKPEEFDKAMEQAHLGTPEGEAKVLAWLASDEADYVRGMVTTR
jgi:NAD(P)-dependent dehydrogenase (short-subunit alcohol dehydrogenase family)